MHGVAVSIARLAILVLFAQGAVAWAQGANPHNGTWKLMIQTPRTAYVEGVVEVKDSGGNWHTVARDSRDICAGRDAPIVVRTATPEQLEFRVMRSKVMTGCPDFQVPLKRVDDARFEGALSNGFKVQLTRQ